MLFVRDKFLIKPKFKVVTIKISAVLTAAAVAAATADAAV